MFYYRIDSGIIIMSKSIRSVLETLVAGIEACVENNKVDIKQESVEVDQAIKDIAQIIDEAERGARIDELKRLWNKTQPDIIPEGVEPSNFSGSCILVRLKELEGDK